MIFQGSGHLCPHHPLDPRMSLFYLVASADPEGGGQGVRTPTPWKITSYMGFYREKAIGPPPPLEKIGPPPPGKCWDTLWNLEKIIDFFEIDHL